ncbi:glycolate oxidase [Massilia sp. WF1]|uniref:glycolate oxidase subunit GlcE n=1 Tax=unclassified Massilia TaxID=2609279 RepID=UPI0006904193|nr:MULTISPECIES: glycolate oxidase subunit GlcE [unclassified Massilia]ALK95787.1 glycolate oxidase [Massilia sp. WG5]KNZ67994.1 glycolate oxidase [Massilia sp. WF1]
MQQILEQFQDQVRSAANDKRALRIRGGGTKDWYGQRIEGEILDTRPYAGIVDYEPTELVITARCGTPLAEIEALLAERKQMLAFEPPHFGEGATLGGAIAAGLSGPRRASSGALRDFVLGAKLVDGKGELLTFGGQVMKNVAGYDVSRLLAGSLGTLGLLLEVSVKVLPLAYREATLRFEMSEVDAIRTLNEWAGQPLPISASCWIDGVLALRLSGAQAAVDAAIRSLGGAHGGPHGDYLMPDCAAFWAGLREQRHAFFDGDTPLWRLSVPPTASALVLGGPQLIEWGGAQRWLRADGDAITAQRIRATVSACGGHATLFRGGDKNVGVFQPLAPAIARIHERLKAGFDPANIFNPGRMY